MKSNNLYKYLSNQFLDKMARNLTNILVVEDNPRFSNAASDAIAGLSGKATFAIDYNQAMQFLENRYFSGAIIDCFFPMQTGSQKRELGLQAIEKLIGAEQIQRMSAYEQALKDFLDFEGSPDLKKLARYLGSRSGKDPLDDPVVAAIMSVGSVLGKNVNSLLRVNDMNGGIFRRANDFKDYETELRTALDKDEANQALGIYVAEEASRGQIPFVLATSTYHHDALTQPIHDYCGQRHWALIDCSQPDEKATAVFWQHAYDVLSRR